MKKDDKIAKDTKLNWRLRDLPTANELVALVEQGIIDKDEARHMLVNEVPIEQNTNIEKELKRQIEFLEALVKKLTTKGGIHNSDLFTWVERYTPIPVRWSTGSYITTTANTLGSSGTNLVNYVGSLTGKS